MYTQKTCRRDMCVKRKETCKIDIFIRQEMQVQYLMHQRHVNMSNAMCICQKRTTKVTNPHSLTNLRRTAHKRRCMCTKQDVNSLSDMLEIYSVSKKTCVYLHRSAKETYIDFKKTCKQDVFALSVVLEIYCVSKKTCVYLNRSVKGTYIDQKRRILNMGWFQLVGSLKL